MPFLLSRKLFFWGNHRCEMNRTKRHIPSFCPTEGQQGWQRVEYWSTCFNVSPVDCPRTESMWHRPMAHHISDRPHSCTARLFYFPVFFWGCVKLLSRKWDTAHTHTRTDGRRKLCGCSFKGWTWLQVCGRYSIEPRTLRGRGGKMGGEK